MARCARKRMQGTMHGTVRTGMQGSVQGTVRGGLYGAADLLTSDGGQELFKELRRVEKDYDGEKWRKMDFMIEPFFVASCR